jgi:hypothetical protein
MPGSRQLHTVLLISQTFASRRHQQHCCASAKIQARILTNPILQSEFEIRFLFLNFHLLFSKNQTTRGYLQQLLADFRNIFCTILVAALQMICEKRLLVNHKKTTAN